MKLFLNQLSRGLACIDGLTGFTNAIEGFNRQLRKVTKNKSVFPTNDSLLKLLYPAMIDITKKMDRQAQRFGTNPYSA